jgi:predicted ATPase
LLAQHHRLLRGAVADAGGFEVRTEGDSFFVVFTDPLAAVRAAIAAQRAVSAATWPDEALVAVRMGLHTGRVDLSDGEYVGLELHRAARIAATAHGGQVVLSSRTREAVSGRLPDGVRVRDLGEHRLKDISEPERLFQLDVEGLRTEFPPLASLSARFRALPAELSTFVGREAEIEAIGRLLAGTRLLTLTGPGGTGKSRLALRVARDCDERFHDGVAFVALAPITDPELVAPTIRGALGFAEEPGRSALETLIDQLRMRELLLLLDNFEQVLPAASDVARLLTGIEQLSVLVTSRAALHLSGEQEFAVPPLGLPQDGRLADPDAIGRSEAVSLFVERARLARPDFQLDQANARTVALITARLDGLPLAIELAASRIKLLSPDALLARLSRRLEILASTGADVADRQRTLRATIDWSHDLLDGRLRAIFRRVAAFTGGASLEAIEALVPGHLGQGAGSPLPEVLDGLASLVDHSLLRRDEAAAEPRFQMLETVREYALEQLSAAGEAEAMAEAHAGWFLDLVIRLSLSFTAGPAALDRVEVDHDNVRAALRWAVEHVRTELALRSVGALWRFWHLRGHLEEGLGLCDAALALPGAEEATEARARALYARASLHYWRGDSAMARVGYESALEVARACGSRPMEAEAQFALIYVHAIFHEWEAAHAASAAAIELYREVGDRLGVANAQWADAYAWALAGEYEDAVAGFEASIPEVEAAGDQFWTLSHKVTLAWTLQRLGQGDRARALMAEVLELSIDLGDRTGEQLAVHGLASFATQEGDVERGLRLAGAAEVIAEGFGARAPSELVIAQDPVALARERGVTDDDAHRLILEGRLMARETVLEMAQDFAARRA